MTSGSSFQWAAIALTLLAVTAQTLGNFAMSIGLKRSRLTPGWRAKLVLLFRRPWLPLAIGLLAIHFFTWLEVLKTASLAVVVPLTAFSHVLNAALVGPLLGEVVTAQRWLGTAIIVSGILLVIR